MKLTQEFIDEVLILRCQLRDRQAFAELIDRYQRPVRYFIARLVGSSDLADELAQETWLAVLSKIHTLRNAGTFSVWLYRIARNKVYQELRRRKVTIELDESLAAPDVMESRPELVPTFIIVWQALLLIAVIFTVSLYVRSRTLTMHQIQSSLAHIEEHLKKMSEKE